MNPIKTRGFPLRILPYRESSSIVYLYSEQFGLLHGIAKGMRRRSKGYTPVERGTLVEVMAYVRPHRSMHTLGAIDVLEFYPGVRTDLLRSSLRDAAFETMLRGLHPQEPNPELFALIGSFLGELEANPDERGAIQWLWRFYGGLARTLGFGIDLGRCALCGSAIGATCAGVALLVEHGGVACDRCVGPGRTDAFIPRGVVAMLCGEVENIGSGVTLALERRRAITRALARYCCHHADVRDENRALDFLCEILPGGVEAVEDHEGRRAHAVPASQ